MKFKRFVVLILACTVLEIPSTLKAIEQEGTKVPDKVVRYEDIKDNIEEVIKEYKKAAKKGDAEAQYNLGICLFNGGNGVERNQEEAVQWYKKAAEQGYAAACVELGDCYQFGKGVERNQEESEKWYKKAAEQGYVAAYVKLGTYCTRNNKEEAEKWFKKGAEQGCPFAQYKLINYYLRKETKADYNEAVKWIKILSENENYTKRHTSGYDFRNLESNMKTVEKKIKKEEIFSETTAYRNDITYTNLVRHPSDYENQRVNFYGKVLEVYEDSDCVNLVIATNISDYSCILCCEYDPSIATTRILEDDYVTVFGISVGLVGEMTKYPGIYVERIEIGNYSSHKK